MENYTLLDDGTLDTVISCDLCGHQIRLTDTSAYRDEDGALDLDALDEDGELYHDCDVDENENDPIFQRDPRTYALNMVDDGLIDPGYLILSCLNYMSCDNVRDMLDTNEISPRFLKV